MPSALCLHQISSSIEINNFYTNLALKNVFFVFIFADISARSSQEEKADHFLYLVYGHCFFLHSQWCVRISGPIFCRLFCSGSRDTTLASFLRFVAGPARTSTWDLVRDNGPLLNQDGGTAAAAASGVCTNPSSV